MANKFLLIILLIPAFASIDVNAVTCLDGNTNKTCTGQYCYYISYATYVSGSVKTNKTYQGCRNDFKIEMPPNSKAYWTFPVNHCQHFQTNQTDSTYQYFYGNVCDTRDNCTYHADSTDLVCAGFQTSPTLALLLTIIAGIFMAKIFV
jgi:hypothetical protein